MTKLKVVHLLSSSAFHGAEAMVVELCRATTNLGIECHLLSFDNRGRGNLEAGTRLQGICTSTPVTQARWQFDPETVSSIRRIVKSSGINIVHSHSYKATFHALLARQGTNTALVATYHNWIDSNLKDRVYGVIDRQLARGVDIAAGVSEKVVSRLNATVRGERIRLIHNGIDTERFGHMADRSTRRRTLSLADQFTVGFVGRLTPKKGVQDLLIALSLLPEARRPRLLVVGDGEFRMQLESRAADLGLCDLVTFAGNQANIQNFYAAMDVLALPSYEEGFPMVILEALASEVPVIASRVGDIPKILIPGENGWLFEPGNVADLASALHAASDPATDLARMGLRGRELVVNRFSAKRMAEDYVAAYERALELRGIRPS